MTIQECYEKLGGDYNDALTRLLKEERVMKYVLLFLEEHSFEQLAEAMSAEDYDAAFKYAHNMKGVCQNISFNRLYEPTFLLTDALRESSRDIGMAMEYFIDLQKVYQETVAVIREFQKGCC